MRWIALPAPATLKRPSGELRGDGGAAVHVLGEGLVALAPRIPDGLLLVVDFEVEHARADLHVLNVLRAEKRTELGQREKHALGLFQILDAVHDEGVASSADGGVDDAQTLFHVSLLIAMGDRLNLPRFD